MKTSIEDFNYSLPKKLIATEPLPRRDGSKLLTYNRTTGLINHENFNDILKYFTKGDMIILNNTKL